MGRYNDSVIMKLNISSAADVLFSEHSDKRLDMLENFYREVSKDPEHIEVYLQKYEYLLS